MIRSNMSVSFRSQAVLTAGQLKKGHGVLAEV